MISVLSRYFVMVKELSEETPLALGMVAGSRIFFPKYGEEQKLFSVHRSPPITSPLFDLFILMYILICVSDQIYMYHINPLIFSCHLGDLVPAASSPPGSTFDLPKLLVSTLDSTVQRPSRCMQCT